MMALAERAQCGRMRVDQDSPLLCWNVERSSPHHFHGMGRHTKTVGETAARGIGGYRLTDERIGVFTAATGHLPLLIREKPQRGNDGFPWGLSLHLDKPICVNTAVNSLLFIAFVVSAIRCILAIRGEKSVSSVTAARLEYRRA
jgi:hypothetical protein